MDLEMRLAERSGDAERIIRLKARCGDEPARRELNVLEGRGPGDFFPMGMERSGTILLLFDRFTFGDRWISIQAGQGLYSEPRRVVPVSEYTEWEVGAIPNLIGSAVDLLTWEWPGYPSSDSLCVAPYTPTKIVKEVLNRMYIEFGD